MPLVVPLDLQDLEVLYEVIHNLIPKFPSRM